MNKFALLIGVSDYPSEDLTPLPAAVRDAAAMRGVLVHNEMGQFPEANVTLLENPARVEMETAIQTLFSGRYKDDLVLLFFSGHGIKDDTGQLYLATQETRKINGELVRPTAVAARDVHDYMQRSRSRRQVVILDSCFSGAFPKGLTVRDDGKVDIREQLGGEGRAILTASGSTQYAFEDQQELSVYTRFLVRGIETGEADENGNDIITIGELHDYACKKVQEERPTMRPEIHPGQEGYTIRLARVPIGDPREKYAKKVEQLMDQGRISIIGRGILDVFRDKIGLDAATAEALEAEILEQYRQKIEQEQKEHEAKRDRYRQTLEKTLGQGDPTDTQRAELRHLQQVLGVSEQDAREIELEVRRGIEAYREKLRDYESVLLTALKQTWPDADAARDRCSRKAEGITPQDLARMEKQAVQQAATHHENLRHYEQAFRDAAREQYPLADGQRAQLQARQQQLGLSDTDIDAIQEKIGREIRIHGEKLQQYEQVLSQVCRKESPLGDKSRREMSVLQAQLELTDKEIEPIHARVEAQCAREAHEQRLHEYESIFRAALAQTWPDVEKARGQCRQESQGLTDVDITAVEKPVVAKAKAAYEQRLREYESAFRAALTETWPDVEKARKQCQQESQGLGNVDITTVEKIVARAKAAYEQGLREYKSVFRAALAQTWPDVEKARKQCQQESQGLGNVDITTVEKLVVTEAKAAYEQRLREYESAFRAALVQTWPDVEKARKQCQQESQGLADSDIATVEQTAIAEREAYSKVSEAPPADKQPASAEDTPEQEPIEEPEVTIQPPPSPVSSPVAPEKSKKGKSTRVGISVIAALVVAVGVGVFTFMGWDERSTPATPISTPVPPETGKLIVRSNVSGDRVFIDGKSVGATGPESHTLAPGKHEIRVEKEGFKTFKEKVRLVAGGEEIVQARLEPEIPSHGPEMVSIRGGCFQMGSPGSEKGRDDDERRHRVCVEGFALGKTEVTFAEYDRFARATGRELPSDRGWGRGKRPVIYVSWHDATAYAEWLSGQTGKQYRLPTEAEWEYAARAGTTTPFSTGECISTSQANYDGNYDYANCVAKGVYREKTVPAGSLPANPWGLHEIHGNVWEWTCSLYKANYDGSEKRCTSKGSDGSRALRGGSWDYKPWWLRSAFRDRNFPDAAINYIGFRLARDF